MKIRTVKKPYDEVIAIEQKKRKKPIKPNIFFRILTMTLSVFSIPRGFTYKKIGMERLSKKEPCLILMNHSSFVDFKIASKILFPRPFNIICTSDGFVGKSWLMRVIGCIPTQKFVTDLSLVRDIIYAVRKKKSSILMYPEASYSFDGTSTTLPESLGMLVKKLGVPLVMIRTYGAFNRDPLYNNLQIRKVKVSADMKYLLSPEEIEKMSTEELNETIRNEFSFDNFKWQQENEVRIDEPFRADCLNRVLFKCPHCMAEGKTEGKGTHLTCHSCGKVYELDEYGYMKALEGDTEYPHIPDWYAWERECVKQEIVEDRYGLDIDVDICMLVNTRCLYRVGEGRLTHSKEGFRLTGCDRRLDYTQPTLATYSLYADYYWYEIGDVICIGTNKVLYYCFPKNCGDVVAKTRLATEELYKLAIESKKGRK